MPLVNDLLLEVFILKLLNLRQHVGLDNACHCNVPLRSTATTGQRILRFWEKGVK